MASADAAKIWPLVNASLSLWCERPGSLSVTQFEAFNGSRRRKSYSVSELNRPEQTQQGHTLTCSGEQFNTTEERSRESMGLGARRRLPVRPSPPIDCLQIVHSRQAGCSPEIQAAGLQQKRESLYKIR